MAIDDFFKQDGRLAAVLSHYAPRAGQIELAESIEEAINNSEHLIAEAGTGIGKTFSYLIPSLAHDKSVLISTATKHLQEQVFFKDMPLVEKIFNRKFSACLLKGRANYLCLSRYETLLSSTQPLSKKHHQYLKQIENWQAKTTSGDLAEILVLTEADGFFQKKITSTVDNCLGSDCPRFSDCYVQKVREQAKKSQPNA